MPTVYRITRAPYADLSGDGARLAGGRWNHPGTAAVYTSENRALAVLETLVHTHPDRIPKDLVLLTTSIPDHASRTTWTANQLPAGWRDVGNEPARDQGTRWLASQTAATLWLPSAILPAESTVILNPMHPAHPDTRIVDQEPFSFDPRLLVRRAVR